MNEFLRERIVRKLDTLSDERLYQVLDYVEFLESKYAQRQPPGQNVFQRFAEGVEDTLRAGRVSATTIAETMNLMNRAMSVLGGVAAAGKSVASDIAGAAGAAIRSAQAEAPAGGGGTSLPPAPPAVPPPTPPATEEPT